MTHSTDPPPDDPNPFSAPIPSADPGWPARRVYWQRKLRRLHLNAEPISEQLDRYRRVTWVLTLVSSLLALAFVALFAAFHAALVGLVVGAVLLLPIISLAWLDYVILRRRVDRYESERRAHDGGERSKA